MAGNRQGAMKAAATLKARRAAERGEPIPDATAAPPPPANDLLGRRLAVPLTDEGRIDWDRVPPAQRDVLDMAVRRETPIAAAPLTAEQQAFDDALVGMLYDAISSVSVTIARASGYSVNAAAMMKFSAEEKAALIPPTNKVLAKYSGFLGQYQDEVMLAVCLGSIVSAKVTAMRQMEPHVSTAATTDHGEPLQFARPS